jgi:hypothetical protein
MARFKLKGGSRPEQIGKIILDAAYARAGAAEPPSDVEIAGVADRLREHFDTTKESPPQIELHYDSRDLLHFVIPYLGSKETLQPPPDYDEDKHSLAKIAYEAMGTVVIRGCGK